MHVAGPLGLKGDKYYQAAYWKAFEEFFGARNAATVKAMLIARNPIVDTGEGDIDKVCYGLRQTMSWLAEAIERKALASIGQENANPPPRKVEPAKRAPST